MDYSTQIIDKIKRNRISSTEVADCLNKSGNIHGVYALNKQHFRVGKVFWCYAYNESNWEFHEQIKDVPDNQVVIAESFNCKSRAIFGSLVSKYLMLYKQASAIVVQGYLRDIPHLIKENWPIWLEGVTPIGCYNKKNDKMFDEKICQQRRTYFDDAIAVCDDSGVVIIPKAAQTDEFLQKLYWIEEQEDIWFDCIDRLKWNTYDTVCLKNYKKESKN